MTTPVVTTTPPTAKPVVTRTPEQDAAMALSSMAPKFASALPSTIPVERFLRSLLTSIQKNPYLLSPKVDRASLYLSSIECAQQGLMPDGYEAALVPFKGKVRCIRMVGGLLKQFRDSGQMMDVTSHVVYRDEIGECFRHWLDDDGEHVRYEPNYLAEGLGAMALVFAQARLKDGGRLIEVMTREQVEAIKARSASKDDQGRPIGPWVTDESEMWRKTVLRRLGKRLPSSTDQRATAVEDDDEDDATSSVTIESTQEPAAWPSQPANPTRPDRLAELIGAKGNDTAREAAPATTQPEPQSALGPSIAEGIVQGVKVLAKQGDNNESYTLYLVTIAGETYSTFSDTIGKTLLEAADSRAPVRFTYEAVQKGDKTYRNIMALSQTAQTATPQEPPPAMEGDWL